MINIDEIIKPEEEENLCPICGENQITQTTPVDVFSDTWIPCCIDCFELAV